MIRKLHLALLVFLTLLVGTLNVSPSEVKIINKLPYVITSPGYYVLSRDFTDFNATLYGLSYPAIIDAGIVVLEGSCAIKINTSNIVLDGGGHILDGLDDHYTYGVCTEGTLTNITIKNLIVADWEYGIYYREVENGNISNSTAISNGVGFGIESSAKIFIINNSATSNREGFELRKVNSSTLTNNRATSNYFNGFRLEHSDNNTLRDNIASHDKLWYKDTDSGASGFYIYSSHNNVLINNIANSNEGPGFYVASSNNNMFKNSTACLNDVGFFIIFSDSNIFLRNNASSNRMGVIIADSSNDNILANNRVILNQWEGFLLDHSDRNVLINNTANLNRYGFSIKYSTRNIITNSTASSNDNGFFVDSSSHNTFLSNNVSSNNFGFYMLSSDNNILSNNIISSNSAYGIYLESSSNNTIYNNLFNNSENLYILPAESTNRWNRAKTKGRNILGGAWLGGNAWLKPNGTGFSETCEDAGYDGICDSPYKLNEANIDYLPLALYHSSYSLTHSYTSPISSANKRISNNFIPLLAIAGLLTIVVVLVLHLGTKRR